VDTRLVQKRFRKTPWFASEIAPDAWLGAQGNEVVGPGLRTSSLLPVVAEELFRLLDLGVPSSKPIPGRRVQTPEESAREKEILSWIPRFGFTHPIDVDVDDDSPLFDPVETPVASLELARKIDAAAAKLGIEIAWFRTSKKGSLHGDLTVPEGVESPWLVRATGWWVAKYLLEPIQAPRLSDLSRRKSERGSALYVDDSRWNSNPDSRGLLWRPAFARKPNGLPKTPIDIYTGELMDMSSASWKDMPVPLPVPDRFFLEGIQAIEAEIRLEEQGRRIRAQRSERRARRGRVVLPGREIQSVLESDLERVKASKRLTAIWNDPPPAQSEGGRSKRDFRFAYAALSEGLDEESVIRLLNVMPGSKTSTRDRRYADGTVRSARKYVDQDLARKPEVQGFDKQVESYFTASVGEVGENQLKNMLRYNAVEAERAGYEKAAGYFWDVVSCGMFSEEEVCREHGVVGARYIVCKQEKVCRVCGKARALIHFENMITSWPERVAITNVVVTEGAFEGDELDQTRALREKIAAKLPRSVPVRWMIGHLELAAVVPEDKAGYLEDAVKAFQGQVEVVGKYRAAEEFLTVRSSPQRWILSQAMRTGWDVDPEEVWGSPWLTKKLTQTSANRSGRKTFPWLNEEQISALTKAKARERRQTAAGSCPKETFDPNAPGGPLLTICGKRCERHLKHVPTGAFLGLKRLEGWRLKEARELARLSPSAEVSHVLPTSREQVGLRL